MQKLLDAAEREIKQLKETISRLE